MAEAYYNLGVILDEKRRPQEATHFYQRALKLKPDHAQALSNLGVIYGRMGRLNEAIKLLLCALTVDPEDPITLFNLAVAYEQLAKDAMRNAKHRVQERLLAKAIKTYEKVLEI